MKKIVLFFIILLLNNYCLGANTAVLQDASGNAQGTVGNPLHVSLSGSGITGVHPAATFVVASSTSISAANANYTCTGTNDGACINTAITALAGAGGKISLLEGTFNIETQILLPSNVTLEGMGAATILKLNNSANINLIQITNGASNWKIQYLQIDGNRTNQNNSAGTIDDQLNNIRGYDTQYGEISHIISHSATSHGIFLSVFASGMIGANIHDNYLYDNGYRCIHIHGNKNYSGQKSIVANNICRADGQNTSGLHPLDSGLFAVFSNDHYMAISNNIISDEPGLGLELSGDAAESPLTPSSPATVTGNIIINSTSSNIWVGAGVQDVNFSNNTSSGSGADGIQFNGGASHISFTGDHILNSAVYGFATESNTSNLYNSITFNGVDFRYNLQGAMNFSGITNFLMSNCMLDDNLPAGGGNVNQIFMNYINNGKIDYNFILDTNYLTTGNGLQIGSNSTNMEYSGNYINLPSAAAAIADNSPAVHMDNVMVGNLRVGATNKNNFCILGSSGTTNVGIGTITTPNLFTVGTTNGGFGVATGGNIAEISGDTNANISNSNVRMHVAAGVASFVNNATTAGTESDIWGSNATAGGILKLGGSSVSQGGITNFVNGNVGIGTASPGTSLDVQGTVRVSLLSNGNIVCSANGVLGHCTGSASCLTTCTCTCVAN